MQYSDPAFYPGGPPQPEEVHLSDYLKVLHRWRRVVLTVFLAVAVGVVFYTFLVNPVYEATATLHVKDEKVKGADFLADLGFARDNPIQTEIEILKSRTNAEEVVRRLHLNWVVEKKGGAPTFRIIEFTSSAREPIYLVRLAGPAEYEIADDNGLLLARGRTGTLTRGENFSLLLQDLQGKQGDVFRLTLAPFNSTVGILRNAVRASEVGKGTNIIKLSYQDNNPDRAAEIINTLAQVYVERSVVLKTQEASRSVEFIGTQLEQVRANLDAAEKDLQGFKSAAGVTNLDSEAQSLIERLASTEKQLAAVALRYHLAKFASDALKTAMSRRESYSPAILLDEPVVATLSQGLAGLEVERKGLLVELSSGHPQVQVVTDRILETQRNLLSTYFTLMEGLQQSHAMLKGDLARYEADLKGLPKAELELARLTRLATVNAEIYTFLLQKYEEARIAKASTISNINVIDPATIPEHPVKPEKKKNILLGIVVGAMVGIGLAFLLEYLDDTIKDADGAKSLLGLPSLAVIPYIGRKGESKRVRRQGALTPEETLIVRLESRAPAAEAFRSLRTSLHFIGDGQKKKVLLVTSTFPGEGKTTIAANLAVTVAETGCRVLLVGCDLRKPTLHEIFASSHTPGLTDCLVGDVPLVNVIQHTGIYHLDIINAGTIPPNPAELLGSGRMQQLVTKLRDGYDLVILDAPPVLAVTDAAVLTLISDRTLVVLEMGGVTTKGAQKAIEILRTTKTPIAGLVLNDKANKGVDYYGYYRGYGSYAYTK